ncbi:MAG: YcgN family cysteine cluster protein [Xanthobacteraceae bacterium]
MTSKPTKQPSDKPFWQVKTLEQMTPTEWESLCDGCGRCCLNKLEEEETGKIFYTDVGCRLFDEKTCRCKDYANRQASVEDCLQLTPEVVPTTPWLPPTCGYRLVSEGKDLYWWHPLVSGDPDTVHAAGISVLGRMSGTEETISDEQLEDHLVDWPMEIPKASRQKK